MSAGNAVAYLSATELGALLDAGDGAIVTLEAGETRLVAHRAVLAARSPVFAAMFQHDTQEARSGVVVIPDVEGAVLRQLVAYCYTLWAPQVPDTAAQLLAAADKYGVVALKVACERQLAAQLADENAAAAAVVAVRHSCPKLLRAAVASIKSSNFHVMATQGWADAVLEHPHDLIEVSRLLSDEPKAETRNLSEAAGDKRLIEAAQEGAVEDLKALLVAGADVGATDDVGLTALHYAAHGGHVAAASLLVEAGAHVDARSSTQVTPLHKAADTGHTAVARLLIASSADPNARNNVGRTPLHWAARMGHAETARALLDAGAYKGAMSDAGKTPLDDARDSNQQHLYEMLS